jgi:hypothetical protein
MQFRIKLAALAVAGGTAALLLAGAPALAPFHGGWRGLLRTAADKQTRGTGQRRMPADRHGASGASMKA